MWGLSVVLDQRVQTVNGQLIVDREEGIISVATNLVVEDFTLVQN
jgi:hypothetical protein